MTDAPEPSAAQPRTLLAEAEEVLAILIDLHVQWFPDLPDSDFIEHHFQPMWRGENTSGDALVKRLEIDLNETQRNNREQVTFQAVALIACAYCVESVKAHFAGATDNAWALIADANYWIGILRGAQSLRDAVEQRARRVAMTTKAARQRHEKDRAIKAMLLAWYRDHQAAFPNLRRAAHAAFKIFEVEFRTAYDWIRAERKRQQPH